MSEHAAKLIADAAHDNTQNDDVKHMDAMEKAVVMFQTLENIRLTPSQGWNFMALYIQAQLTHRPYDVSMSKDAIRALACANEAENAARIRFDNAPKPAVETENTAEDLVSKDWQELIKTRAMDTKVTEGHQQTAQPVEEQCEPETPGIIDFKAVREANQRCDEFAPGYEWLTASAPFRIRYHDEDTGDVCYDYYSTRPTIDTLTGYADGIMETLASWHCKVSGLPSMSIYEPETEVKTADEVTGPRDNSPVIEPRRLVEPYAPVWGKRSFDGSNVEQNQPEAKPDEELAPGIVKEWGVLGEHSGGLWRPGYNFKIRVWPRQDVDVNEAAKYWIHCVERPTQELFDEQRHQWFFNQKCWVRISESDGNKDSWDITEEYQHATAKKSAPKVDEKVGNHALQTPASDDWLEPDATFRIRYRDQRIGSTAYEYFKHRPSGMMLAKYHRANCFAVVESREFWEQIQKMDLVTND